MPTRRDFFSTAVGATCGLALAGNASANEPIKRSGKSGLKLSLAAYSLRDYLAPKDKTKKPALDLMGFVDYCAAQGLQGTELTQYYFPSKVTPEYLFNLKRHAHELGLTISGGAIGNNFCLPAGPKLDAELKKCSEWCEYYSKLGVTAIRVFAGPAPKGESEDAAIDRCIPTLQKACEEAGKHGVILALENHGGVTSNVDKMLRIIKSVDSPWFGVNLDTGNFHTADPYADLAKIAPYAVNVQLKLDMKPAKGKAEKADIKRLIRLIRDAGYTGWVALEYESKDEPYSAIPRALDEMRNAIAG